ncbi:conserved hypothetical protein [Leishmania braziliensis MHOM/BR/75/M2904]|uniref:Uncharacterized protein n=3 Tax=Viannia TaxID=37616 RepID=E9AI35_LEIBR|nr:conserved hypothetical protein [Leishmania braziliensis MHOM/BR/75/M2904]KAI5690671.1 hypothetical protein MNV84_01097 [Leishmania braziliensis]CAJ2467380.1 unnamed protein product [Leishmania braziliensis]CAJ2467995.1 unnamed protein product [Leishmania braziliensis]CBZ14443.1 conserved hypothetical protein [Leishmania braziliensis MHOM/BR/75/M2904]
MVRVGAKRERPCMLVLHVALRAAALPRMEGPQRMEKGAGASASPRELFIWKTSATAEVYATAVMRSMRAYWQLIGGVRYAGPDALTLASAVWQGIDSSTPGPEAAARGAGSAEGASSPSPPPTSATKTGAIRSRQLPQRRQRISATQRRTGVLRCAVHLSRSVYGDAGAVHVLRAACACVTQTKVAVPLSQLAVDDGAATVVDASKAGAQKRRSGRAEVDVGDVMEQVCHAAVHVARVEHVLPARQRR